MGTPHSGKDGTIILASSQETPVLNWTFEAAKNIAYYHSNATGDDYPDRVVGTGRVTGTFVLRGVPSINEGDEVAADFYTGNESGEKYAFTTISIDTISPNVIVDDPGPPSDWTVTWTATSAPVQSTGSFGG